jgi:hypothetical protein
MLIFFSQIQLPEERNISIIYQVPLVGTFLQRDVNLN